MSLDTQDCDIFHSTNTQEKKGVRHKIDESSNFGGTHTESGGTINSGKHISEQYSKGICRLKNAHQFAGKTFVVISQEIVDKLCINQDTWFREDITGNTITLTITQWKENGGMTE